MYFVPLGHIRKYLIEIKLFLPLHNSNKNNSNRVRTNCVNKRLRALFVNRCKLSLMGVFGAKLFVCIKEHNVSPEKQFHFNLLTLNNDCYKNFLSYEQL